MNEWATTCNCFQLLRPHWKLPHQGRGRGRGVIQNNTSYRGPLQILGITSFLLYLPLTALFTKTLSFYFCVRPSALIVARLLLCVFKFVQRVIFRLSSHVFSSWTIEPYIVRVLPFCFCLVHFSLNCIIFLLPIFPYMTKNINGNIRYILPPWRVAYTIA